MDYSGCLWLLAAGPPCDVIVAVEVGLGSCAVSQCHSRRFLPIASLWFGILFYFYFDESASFSLVKIDIDRFCTVLYVCRVSVLF